MTKIDERDKSERVAMMRRGPDIMSNGDLGSWIAENIINRGLDGMPLRTEQIRMTGIAL